MVVVTKQSWNNVFGVVLKADNKLYMVLNNVEYLVRNATVPLDVWKTVVLTWNGNTYNVYDGFTTKTQTASISMENSQTVIGSNLAGFIPNKHLNGQLEMLAYKDEIVNSAIISKLFQTNHMMSVKTYVDNLGRSTKDVINTGLHTLENNYTYKAPGTGKTSLQVESIQKYDNTTVIYGYDSLGNVTSMTNPDGTYEYQYDYLNRLVREYNPKDGQPSGRTLIITYTGNNNIHSKKYYDGNQPITTQQTPIEAYEYKYDNAWKDQLTRIIKYVIGFEESTKVISYASSNFIGNPSQIGSKLLTWSGRRLTAITEPNKPNTEYFYNEEGIRTKKIVGSDITTYELNGSNIISENKNGTQIIRYIYNERGLLVGFEYQKKIYYYIRDLLGIITEIVDENKLIMVSYKYDAWGRLLNKVYTPNTIGEDIAELNNFIYKGYYLDEETGLAVVGKRYYSLELGRFIQPLDVISLNRDSITGLNLYCYANNNPNGIAHSINSMGSISGEKLMKSTSIAISYAIISEFGTTATVSVGANMTGGSLHRGISWPKSNSILMTHYTTPLIKNAFFGSFFGNISYTLTTQLNNSEMFYSYSNIGNGNYSAGIGMNLGSWYGSSAYVSSNIGFGTSMQITPWFTYGAEISLIDGISFSAGIISGNTTQEITANIGWGTIGVALAVSAGIAAVPIPGARILAGAAACVILLIGIFK